MRRDYRVYLQDVFECISRIEGKLNYETASVESISGR